jgi:hypothetical protein
MKALGWFLLGAVSLLAVQALAITVVLARAHGWSAREQPTGVEQWIARWARDAAFPAAAKAQAKPGAQDRRNSDGRPRSLGQSLRILSRQ